MKKITQLEFDNLMELSAIRPRLRRELRFVKSTEKLSDEFWQNSELLSIDDRSGSKGVLLLDLKKGFYVVPYELNTGIVSSVTGRSQSVICDLCRTWQYGDKSAVITIATDRKSSRGYLCCADLKCSLHVRNLTPEFLTSRAQLREDLTTEQRVTRLRSRLVAVIDGLPFAPISAF